MQRKREEESSWDGYTNVAVKVFRLEAKREGDTKIDSKQRRNKKDLLDMGKMLFFPNGQSSKGSQNDFEFDVWDYQDRRMDENSTVGQMYKDTNMSILRFYLASIENEDDGTSPQLSGDMDTDSLPELHSSSIQPTSPSEETPFNDILSEAIQIAGIENDWLITTQTLQMMTRFIFKPQNIC